MYEKIVIFNALLYPLWCFCFSRQILRGRLSPSKTYLCILFMHIILIIGSYELMPDKVPFIFVHLASFLSIVLLHSDPLKKKLFAYFLYTCTIMMMEMLIMCLVCQRKENHFSSECRIYQYEFCYHCFGCSDFVHYCTNSRKSYVEKTV